MPNVRAGGLAQRQALLASLEQQATRIAEWQSLVIPSLDAMVAERIHRQNLLYRRGVPPYWLWRRGWRSVESFCLGLAS